jgi:adenosylmethionine---8-amino-7-oxononanoate aminotransferase
MPPFPPHLPEGELEALLACDNAHIWHPFTQALHAPAPKLITKGQGAWLYDSQGRRILDAIASWWVCLHGHGEPTIARAIAEQAAQLEQVIFADFTHTPAIQLAAKLAALTPGDLCHVFFSDNGSTCVEVALKLAYQYWHNVGEGQRRRFLAFEGGYHGDTFGAMAAGHSSGYHPAFKDLLFPVDLLPYPARALNDDAEDSQNLGIKAEHTCLAALEAWLARYGTEGCAFIFEPIVQGAAGMRMARPEFLRRLLERLKAYNILLIADEVMTGFGRTGPIFASEAIGITPDLLCLSKGLTGGFMPMGVTMTTPKLYAAFKGESFERAFAHGHSYTGNPLGCAAALASLELLMSAQSQAQRSAIAASLHTHWPNLVSTAQNKLIHARHIGTIAALNWAEPSRYGSHFSQKLRQYFLQRGILLRPIGSTIYLLPPYSIEAEALMSVYNAIADLPHWLAEP